MVTSTPRPIVQVPIDSIRILNPRSRGRRQHDAIVENVAAIGLKRPITVSRRASSDSAESYDLVCGQGRLEAMKKLGESTIPAIVVEKDECECLVGSLVENIARRNHSPHELLLGVKKLRDDGYRDDDIATKIGMSPSYIQNILLLLERGEDRLIAAVDNGTIPIALALEISRSPDAEVQTALAEAYAEGKIRGKQIATVRRLIDQRSTGRTDGSAHNRHSGSRTRRLDPEHLRHIYQRESARQQVMVKKAEFAHARLAVIVQALRELLQNAEFLPLLVREGFSTMPRILEQRIKSEMAS